MEKEIVKYSIEGLIKSMTGNEKPLHEEEPLRNSIGFGNKDIACLLHLIEKNFMVQLSYKEIEYNVSMRSLINKVIAKVEQNEKREIFYQ